MNTKAEACTSYCGLEAFTDIAGDRWSVLILRDISQGITKFHELQSHLGASTAIVSKRLNHLCEQGIITKSAYREPGSRSRFEYLLTQKGQQLGLVLIAMAQFAYQHVIPHKRPQVSYFDKQTGEALQLGFINKSGHPVSVEQIEVVYN